MAIAGQALDLAGTYGVLSLFGVLPAAAVWSQRSADNQQFSAFRVSFLQSTTGTTATHIWKMASLRDV